MKKPKYTDAKLRVNDWNHEDDPCFLINKDDAKGEYVGETALRADAELFAQAPRLSRLLFRIAYASQTNNCGAVNGEAVLCRAFLDEARDLLKDAGNPLPPEII